MCRLYGINTPERGHPGFKAATDHLIGLTQGKLLIHSNKDKTGKYGRYLLTLYTLNDVNINEQMILDGHAVKYE